MGAFDEKINKRVDLRRGGDVERKGDGGVSGRFLYM